jgi:hypothetical protein
MRETVSPPAAPGPASNNQASSAKAAGTGYPDGAEPAQDLPVLLEIAASLISELVNFSFSLAKRCVGSCGPLGGAAFPPGRLDAHSCSLP